MLASDWKTIMIFVPEGFRFGSMDVHAESWEAYDALAEEDGWTERSSLSEDGVTYVYKTLGPWPGSSVVAHTPHEARS